MPRSGRPVRRHCDCGAALRWELRQDYAGKRWLALCANPACGRWTTEDADRREDADPLADFLLGQRTPVRYAPPWVRFFARYAALGWSADPSACGCCGRPLTFALMIPPQASRPGDPFRVVVCLDCGQTVINLWGVGEVGQLHLGAEAWIDVAIAIRALKRTVERCVDLQPGGTADDD